MVRFNSLLSARETVYLHSWEELVATYQGVRKRKEVLIFQFDGYELIFLENSQESKILSEQLAGLKGKKVGIIRTDIVEKPFLIRPIVHTSGD